MIALSEINDLIRTYSKEMKILHRRGDRAKIVQYLDQVSYTIASAPSSDLTIGFSIDILTARFRLLHEMGERIKCLDAIKEAYELNTKLKFELYNYCTISAMLASAQLNAQYFDESAETLSELIKKCFHLNSSEIFGSSMSDFCGLAVNKQEAFYVISLSVSKLS